MWRYGFTKILKKKQNGQNIFTVKSREELKRIAIQVIEDEKKAIEGMIERLGDSFGEAVETLFSAPCGGDRYRQECQHSHQDCLHP